MAPHRQELHGLRPRRALLVAICRRNGIDQFDPMLADRLADRSFRRELLGLASSHRVFGLTVSALARARILDWRTGTDGQEIDDLLRAIRRRAAMFEIQRDRVTATLTSAGVEHVLLKGAAIAPVFCERPYERDVGDLDILVREEKLERSLESLEAEGYSGPPSIEEYRAYRQRHFHIQLRRPGAYVVEVHWALTLADAPFQTDAQAVLAQSTRFERPGHPPLFLPCPEHTLLHLVIQNLQEGFSRLGRLVDVDRIVTATPALDWGALIAAARDANMASAVAVSLQLANRLMGTAVPDDVLRQLRPGPVARFHLAITHPLRCVLSQRLEHNYTAKRLHELWLLGDVGKRIDLLRQVLDDGGGFNFHRRERPGALRRCWRLVKLAVLQSWLYLTAAVAQVTPSGRTRLRFW